MRMSIWPLGRHCPADVRRGGVRRRSGRRCGRERVDLRRRPSLNDRWSGTDDPQLLRASLCEIFRSMDSLPFTSEQIEYRPVRFCPHGSTASPGLVGGVAVRARTGVRLGLVRALQGLCRVSRLTPVLLNLLDDLVQMLGRRVQVPGRGGKAPVAFVSWRSQRGGRRFEPCAVHQTTPAQWGTA